MTGRILAGVIVLAALLAGGAMYYLQVYHFYREVPASGPDDVQLTLTGGTGPAPLAHAGFRAIDADSSPIRYRACFTTDVPPADLAGTYAPYEGASPLTAPGWFDCFDAAEIGTALENGTARAFLARRDIVYGIDRVVAVTEGGRGYVWHQINPCGEKVFDGEPAPEGCPPPPGPDD